MNVTVIDECRMLLKGIMANITTITGIEKGMKEWVVTTPATALLTDGQGTSSWEEEALGLETILQNVARNAENPKKSRFSASTNHSAASLNNMKGERL